MNQELKSRIETEIRGSGSVHRVQYPRGARLETEPTIPSETMANFLAVCERELDALGIAAFIRTSRRHNVSEIKIDAPFADGVTHTVWLHIGDGPHAGEVWYTSDACFGRELRRDGAVIRQYLRVGLSQLGAEI